MSGKVPRGCTEDEISKVGGYKIQVNAIGTSCQLTRLCSDETQECTYVVNATLLATINAELARAKVGVHEARRYKNGKIERRLDLNNKRIKTDGELMI